MTLPIRHLDLAGPANFRDLGGYRTADGRVTRWRRLFRSDSLHRLGAEDVVALERDEIFIRLGLDLRSERELQEFGRGDLFERGARHLHIPLTEGASQARDLAERYLTGAERGRAGVGAVFEALASPDNYPAVYYCTAGKDRTGMITALILLSVGVSEEQIVGDYSLTDEHMSRILGARIERLRLELAARAAAGDPRATSVDPNPDAEQLRARPETIRAFLSGFTARFGSAADYLRDCGVGASTLAGVRAQLLE